MKSIHCMGHCLKGTSLIAYSAIKPEFLFSSQEWPGFQYWISWCTKALDFTIAPVQLKVDWIFTRRKSFVSFNLNQRTYQAHKTSLSRPNSDLLVGSSSAMQFRITVLFEKSQQQKQTPSSWGESGTGKELIANTLAWFLSQRAGSPFHRNNCGSLSPELIDSELFGHVKKALSLGAHKDHKAFSSKQNGGTLILRWSHRNALTEQQVPKLLRVLESGELQNRSVAQQVKIARNATNSLPQPNRVLGGTAIRDEVFREASVFSFSSIPYLMAAQTNKDREGDALRPLLQQFL